MEEIIPIAGNMYLFPAIGITFQWKQYMYDGSIAENYAIPPVLEEIIKQSNKEKSMKESNKKQSTLKRYWPLLILVLITVLAAAALVHGTGQGLFAWMHFFMGFFLCQFAMLKLFRPSGFADGFQMYDLVAKKFRSYAYFYPFIELGLGLAYLSFICPVITYSITLIVMGIGAVGVIRALRKGLDLRCACMGTVLDVPLSIVTLSEDMAMGIMAGIMLIGS